ncbi:MAG: transporter, family, cyanate transporter [Microbacteriaceae bacterium]|nr:transporter, family, cyanate transporter [Microbacteriaceae bacterium]
MVAAVLLIGLNLRGPLVALPPVAAAIRSDLHVSAPAFGLLTSLPVLCFGRAAPLGLVVVRRFGADRAILFCLAGVVAGTVLRSAGPFPLALAATVLLGVAITVGNVAVPVLIRAEVARTARATVTGLYSSGLNTGTMLTSVATVPLAAVLGWRVATAAWSLLGIVAAAYWLWVLARNRAALPPAPGPGPRTQPEPAATARHDLRDALPWLLTVTFSAQAFSYYGVTAWLPTLLHDETGLPPAAAGGASAIFQVAGLIGSTTVPLLARRTRPRWLLMGVGVLWCILPIGLLLAPGAFALWSVVGGAAQGGGFSAIFAILVVAARDERHSSFLSAFVQGTGYVVAAAAPTLVGALHAASGEWALPLSAVVVSTLVFLIVGGFAAASAAGRGEGARSG